jgi:hypothetical protein
MAHMMVFGCADAVSAQAAKNYLTQRNYANITVEQVDVFIYDSKTFGAGGKNDSLNSKIIVIGRE